MIRSRRDAIFDEKAVLPSDADTRAEAVDLIRQELAGTRGPRRTAREWRKWPTCLASAKAGSHLPFARPRKDFANHWCGRRIEEQGRDHDC
jgi:hypothetical protein